MITTLEKINEAARCPEKFIDESDDEYTLGVKEAAKRIAENDDIKVVAISGPSASGKTTTAHILMRELELLGEKTAVVSLDDFYKEWNDLPILPDGSKDIESVNSLDKSLIKDCLIRIIEEGKTPLPAFDFTEHKRTENAKTIDIGNRGIVILEGLHALNTEISGLVPKKNIFKIYITVNRSIENEDGVELLSSRQVRLMRRIIRDSKFRGEDIKCTLSLWNNVVEGEVKYLYPFADTADWRISTLHPFEVCVYKKPFCKLRNEVDRNTPWYDYFIKTVNALELFDEIDEKYVPENSLIREFIG